MASAAELGERFDFANSCIAMPGPDAGKDGDGAVPIAFGVTYPNGAMPSEIHVWAMMTARLRLNVLAEGARWSVEMIDGQARARWSRVDRLRFHSIAECLYHPA